MIAVSPTTAARRGVPRRSEDDLAGLLEPAITELVDRLGATYPTRQIYAEATRAMHDLSGSIHVEALPDMVGRLVADRLSRQRHLAMVVMDPIVSDPQVIGARPRTPASDRVRTLVPGAAPAGRR